MGEKTVRITIEAGWWLAKTGKTTLAALILRALNRHSIDARMRNVEVEAEKLADDPTELERRMQAFCNGGLVVEIEEKHLLKTGWD